MRLVPVVFVLLVLLAAWFGAAMYLLTDFFGMSADVALVYVFGWIAVCIGWVHLDMRRQLRTKAERRG